MAALLATLIVGSIVLVGIADLWADRRDGQSRKAAWDAMHADPRCAASIRILLSSGFAILQMRGTTQCKYCDGTHLATVSGPKKMQTPTGELFVHAGRYHGVACLRCGFLSDGPQMDIASTEVQLLDFVERHSVRITRETYEAELDRLAILAEDAREKLRQLPAGNAYRERAALPEFEPIRRSSDG